MAAELCAALKMLLQMLLARAAAQTFFAMGLGKINIGTSFHFWLKRERNFMVYVILDIIRTTVYANMQPCQGILNNSVANPYK